MKKLIEIIKLMRFVIVVVFLTIYSIPVMLFGIVCQCLPFKWLISINEKIIKASERMADYLLL